MSFDKKVSVLANQVADLKSKSTKPHYPQSLMDKITELRAHFTTTELAGKIGIDLSTIRRRTKASKSKRPNKVNVNLPTALPAKSLQSDSMVLPKLALLPSFSFPLPPVAPAKTAVLEMELPSGVKIRIYS